MQKITELCQKHNLRLVEDCAQSHGARFQGQMTGTFGDIGCFSFYPSKNLGGFGDGGAIVTDDPKIAADMKMYRNYGSEKRYYNKVVGANSRLDELQAGLLRVRLSHLEALTEERRRDLVKDIKKMGEEGKVAVRNIRRDAIEKFKQMQKKSEITEDDLKDLTDEIQKVTDAKIKAVDDAVKNKENEIMEI